MSGTEYPEGSSPLTRGKLTSLDLREVSLGLIPTHAGKTSTMITTDQLQDAHPHSRGENLGRGLGRSRRSGSSPLTRGKQTLWGLVTAYEGLIPTHAGKTS